VVAIELARLNGEEVARHRPEVLALERRYHRPHPDLVKYDSVVVHRIGPPDGDVPFLRDGVEVAYLLVEHVDESAVEHVERVDALHLRPEHVSDRVGDRDGRVVHGRGIRARRRERVDDPHEVVMEPAPVERAREEGGLDPMRPVEPLGHRGRRRCCCCYCESSMRAMTHLRCAL
ncbi:hypothetical protein THAOC_24808, partial [Thalassiosira oceanica]